jgi:hypothetical protein
MNNSTTLSAAVTFLLATQKAIPKTLGDRERIAVMSDAMRMAVCNRFQFDLDDAAQLKRLGIQTCVGVFRPMDYYGQACISGGTYPRMWEQFNNIAPWRGARVAFYDRDHRRITHTEDGRVCEGIAFLMPPEFSVSKSDVTLDAELASFDSLQVWWCTGISADSINLTRYEPTPGRPDGAFCKPGGAPARRRKLTREEWEVFQNAVRVRAGKSVRMKWTAQNETDSFMDGWGLHATARRHIAYMAGSPRALAVDQSAVAYVQEQAAKGNVLALKALLIHEVAQKVSELDQPQPAVEETPKMLTLSI